MNSRGAASGSTPSGWARPTPPGLSGLAPDLEQATGPGVHLAAQVTLGRQEDCAAAVTFLASGQSGFITGSNLYVDGVNRSWSLRHIR